MAPAPDSPRASVSPPPAGIQGDLELELMGLANALYNVGSTVIHDSSKDEAIASTGKPVGLRVTEVIQHLATLDTMGSRAPIMVPMQVLADIDNSRNPMQLTRERLERAATENQFMNGKIHALESYRTALDEALCQNFPELQSYLRATGGHDDASPAEGESTGMLVDAVSSTLPGIGAAAPDSKPGTDMSGSQSNGQLH